MKSRNLTLAIILIASIIIGLFNSCCKDENPSLAGCQKSKNEYYYKTIDGAKSYLWAKPGSYWIYKNTKTGDLDTQTVTNLAIIPDTSIGFRGSKKKEKLVYIIYERLFINIFSSFNNWVYVNSTNEYNANSKMDLNYSFVSWHSRVFSEGWVIPFVYSFYDGQGDGTGSSSTFFRQLIPSMPLQGKTYQNVAVFEVDRNEIEEPKMNCLAPKTKYYWAEHVGLIKKEFITCNYSWELIEYNIIP